MTELASRGPRATLAAVPEGRSLRRRVRQLDHPFPFVSNLSLMSLAGLRNHTIFWPVAAVLR
jgi:hypothetical protein